jgi:ABC-2 type transport system permease protein
VTGPPLRLPAVRTLLWKELRQIRRNRSALVTSLLMPALLLVGIPLAQFRAFQLASAAATESTTALVAAGQLSPTNEVLLGRFAEPLAAFTELLFPLFVTLSGVLAAPMTAMYTVVAERERRSLDLLMALPVSVSDILAAKVLSVLLLGTGVTLPMYAITASVVWSQGAISAGYATLLLLVLLAALTSSVGVTLVVTLLARDYRTANNLSGLQIVPVLFGGVAILLLVPGLLRFALLSLLLLLIGGVALVVAQRWITFERYLS